MTNKKLFSLPTLILFLSAFLLFPSCNQEQRARKMPESVSAYVYGYTSGIISRSAPIRVRFATLAADEAMIGQEADGGLLTFSPGIAGTATWEDAQTLRFDPAAPLASGTGYVATVHLKDILPEVPAEAASFEFDFRTRDQYFDLSIDGISAPNSRDLSKQELQGALFTADLAEEEAVEAVLSAQQQGRKLPVRWSHSADGTEHYFYVEGIRRSKEASAVQLSWNGNPLGVSLRDSREVEIPAIDDFKVTGARVVQGQGQYIQLHFSDPLLESQPLEGLVRIAGYGSNFRFVIDGNKLRVYPTSRLAGQHTIEVAAGIRNVNDERMRNPSEWAIQIEEAKPQVRLAGSGVIMPNSDGLIFPFEAVGLSAVEVEVFKIHHDNILQFLQVNELDGNNELHRVGRIIMQKKVPLANLNPNANTAEWTRYALDLKELIREDGQAVYQIRLGFRPEYSNYFCSSGREEEAPEIAPLTAAPGEEELESIMDSWYGFSGYYSGYSWEQREDPCYPAYYNSNRFVQRNVIASNLGLIAKGGTDNSYLVVASDLRTSAPISGAKLQFYDFQQQLLGEASTDEQGMATAKLPRKPFVVTAEQGGQRGYLRLEDGNSLSLSRFDVSGAVAQKGLKGFLYGDRGVWRPGDSVYLNFILEDQGGKLPPNYPATFELRDPRGQLQERRVITQNTNYVYPLHFATRADDPTGAWMATVKAGGATFEKPIRIETVKPNRIKVELGFGAEELDGAREPISATLSANWLHGAPAANLKAKVEAQLRSGKTAFDGYDNYVFDDPARSIESQPSTVFDGTLDANGKARLQFRLAGKQPMPGRLTANFKTRVFERGGDFSTDTRSLPYNPYEVYAGIRIPESKYGEKRLEVGQRGSISLATLTKNGKPAANRRLSVGLYRLEWRWWWDSGYDDVSRFNSSSHYDALLQEDVSTNNRGEAEWGVTPEEWGRYLVRVCDTETGHCTGDFFYAGYPWYGEGEDNQRQAAAMLNFASDKPSYNVGEQVKLTLPEGKAGRVLVTIENGTKVLESFWAESEEGENTFTFKAKPEMAPTAYAHVAMIQPHAQVENDLPIRMYGVIPIGVEDPATRLAPELKMPDELKPEQTFTVEVSEASGKPMAYTLAVVDEGLLGLTRFRTPNPWDAFYAKEALGVRTWDVYDQVLGAYGAELERLLSIGGDGEIRRGAQEDRANRFEPVVMHLGPFQLKKGKTAKHELLMPNYVGAVRAMVVAADAGTGAYGSAEKTAPVRQPLMVLGTLPRVLSPGEQLQLPVNVFAMDNKVRNATIRVEEQSGLVNMGAASRTVQFSQPGDQLVNFPIEVGERVGVARFTITASGNGESAKQEIEIQVRNPNSYVTDVDNKVLDGGQAHTFAFTPSGMAGTNEAVLEVSSIPPINLGERLDYLLRYPYGCLEQTLSGGFPQLYVNQLMELNEAQQERIPRNINATIDRLKQFQVGQGGFAYWPGGNTPDHWATSYAGHFLLEAQALGYSIPSGMLEKWTQFQKKVARMWNPKMEEYGFFSRNNYELMQAYRLYTLALAKSPDMAAMNRLREYRGLTLQANWALAAAYAAAGKPEAAKAIADGLSTEVPKYQELSYTYGSTLRDRAMILETLLLLGEREQAATLVKYLSDELSSRRWCSTQEIAFSLLAIGKYVGKDGVQSTLAFAYQIQGGKTVNAGSNRPVMQIQIPLDGQARREVKVSNSGKGTLFARIIRTGQPLAGAETAAASNLKIEVAYKDMQGARVDPSALPQGTDFIAEVRVIHPGSRPMPYQELALTQVFPSGWEIINTRMDNIEAFSQSARPQYQDIRDDRVNTFFGLPERQSETYRVQLNAAYQGRFYLPAVSCEAMYDNSINARAPGRWVEVTPPRES